MKTKLPIILSLLSFVSVVILIGFWIFGAMKLSVVSLDTFIGVIVALLAIIFTLVIGWQIINTIEMRDKITELEKRQNQLIENERLLAENDKLHTMEAYNLQAGLCQTSAEIDLAKGQYIEAFTFYHASLSFAILANTPDQLNRLNQLQPIISLITTKPTANFASLAQQINNDSYRIRQSMSYRNCFSGYYEQIMKDFWEKINSLDLETPSN